jgi:glucose-1-phosphate thymidylyltransferase
MQAVILAAGAGKRLRPLTLTRSKAMAPICGKPIIERVAEAVAAAGVHDFVFVVADLHDDVAAWAQSWRGPGSVQLALQPTRSGMGHALRCAAPLLRPSQDGFILSSCDNLFEPASYRALLERHRREPGIHGTLSTEEVHDPEEIRRTGIITLDGEWVTSIVEKPEPDVAPSNISSMPCYVFSPRILDYLPEIPASPRGEYELQDAIRMVIERDGRVQSCPIPQRWHLTTPDDLRAINRVFLDLGETQPTADATCLPPVHVGEGVTFGPGCTIGPEAVLESGCHIGAGAVVRRAVVLADAVVPDGAMVEDGVVAGEVVV